MGLTIQCHLFSITCCVLAAVIALLPALKMRALTFRPQESLGGGNCLWKCRQGVQQLARHLFGLPVGPTSVQPLTPGLYALNYGAAER